MTASPAISMPAYLIDCHHVSQDDAAFTDALAAAHASRRRPVCLCQPQGPAMYVARLGATFIIKRMPGTGSCHAPSCSSHERSAEVIGRDRCKAITEIPHTRETLLKLDFALSRTGTPPQRPRGDSASRSPAQRSRGLTLRGLLRYLWEQAGITRWQPEFATQQSWSTVRRHLLAAADGKIVGGRPLKDSLYIPEAFYAEHREAIAARRTARWAQCEENAGGPAGTRHPLTLLLGELKKIVPARCGHVAIIKHIPDQPFALPMRAYQPLVQDFSRELSLWGAADRLRMTVIAAFALDDGMPTIEHLAVAPTNTSWVLVEDAKGLQLIDRH